MLSNRMAAAKHKADAAVNQITALRENGQTDTPAFRKAWERRRDAVLEMRELTTEMRQKRRELLRLKRRCAIICR